MSDDDQVSVEKTQSSDATSKWKPLRTWPVWVLLAIMLVTRLSPQLMTEPNDWVWMVAAFGPVLGSLGILLWWISLSRARWHERLVGFFATVGLGVVIGVLVDPSMRGPGMMVMMIPMGMAGFAIGAILMARQLTFRRTLIALVLMTLGFSFSLLVRNEGMWGNYAMGLKWRWTPTSEDKVMARADTDADIDTERFQDAIANPQWPGFRGPNRDGVQTDVLISSDWKSHPLELVWKVPVGPGWSSFAVAGDLLFTQEQRGANEVVVCYDAKTGNEVWAHEFTARFDDPLGGPGPRATPTIARGALFALGATGELMRLDPFNGTVAWQKSLKEVANRQPPMWGFASSPLVVDDKVIVHAGGSDDKGLLAFDVENGDLVWSAPSGDHSYSSPQLVTLFDRPTVLCLTNQGLDFVNPSDGTMWLNHAWPVEGGYRAMQPQLFGEDKIVIPSTMGDGTRAIQVAKDGEQLKAEVLWTSRSLKPDFNDMVVFEGNGFGFDGTIFASIDLETGDRNWKNGRYGKGQVLLLKEAGLLLVLTEKGDAVLVEATGEAFNEVARQNVLEGKTWNHPVLIGDRLLVRNSQEAACYRMPQAATETTSADTTGDEDSMKP